MIFNVIHVSREVIHLWVTPDNPLGVPRIRVVANGRETRIMQPNESHPILKEWGWHATGECGFGLSEDTLPGMMGADRLEIYEADHNILLYRRPRGDDAARRRVFWLDYGIAKERAIQGALFPHFEMSYFNIQNLPQDVLNSVIQIKSTDSLCLAGSLFFRPYESLIHTNEFLRVILVQDPYVELATRLHWLRARASGEGEDGREWRRAEIEAPCAFAAELKFGDVGDMRRAFKRIDVPSFNWLSNPLTRHLACNLPNEQPREAHAFTALDTISRFDVVGHRGFWRPFVVSLFDRLGREGEAPREPVVPDAVLELAAHLREIRPAAELVALDLDLSEAVANTVAKFWSGEEASAGA